MNNRSQANADEDEIRDLLKPLREIESPTGLDVKCLDATREFSNSSISLAQRRFKSNGLTRLYVSSLAASLMIGASIGWVARGQVAEDVTIDGSALTDAAVQSQIPAAAFRNASSELADATSVVDYQEGLSNAIFATQEFYLCGVGRIRSKSEFLLQGELP